MISDDRLTKWPPTSIRPQECGWLDRFAAKRPPTSIDWLPAAVWPATPLAYLIYSFATATPESQGAA